MGSKVNRKCNICSFSIDILSQNTLPWNPDIFLSNYHSELVHLHLLRLEQIILYWIIRHFRLLIYLILKRCGYKQTRCTSRCLQIPNLRPRYYGVRFSVHIQHLYNNSFIGNGWSALKLALLETPGARAIKISKLHVQNCTT